MSFTYKILEKFVKLIRFKKIFLLPKDKILNYARRQNQKPSFKIQNEKDLYFEDKTFLSQRLIILHSKNKRPGAIIFIWRWLHNKSRQERSFSCEKNLSQDGKGCLLLFLSSLHRK